MGRYSSRALYFCLTFKDSALDRSTAIVNRIKACHNYLATGHFARECRSQGRRKKCGRNHHSLRHHDSRDQSSTSSTKGSTSITASSQQSSSESIQQAAYYAMTTTKPARQLPKSFLITSHVIVTFVKGQQVKARALLYPGSTNSAITQWLANQLRLQKNTLPCKHQWRSKCTGEASPDSLSFLCVRCTAERNSHWCNGNCHGEGNCWLATPDSQGGQELDLPMKTSPGWSRFWSRRTCRPAIRHGHSQ